MSLDYVNNYTRIKNKNKEEKEKEYLNNKNKNSNSKKIGIRKFNNLIIYPIEHKANYNCTRKDYYGKEINENNLNMVNCFYICIF